MGLIRDPCTAVMRSVLGPSVLMCAGSPRFCRSSTPGTAAAGTVLPVLLHPELLPVQPRRPCPYRLGGEFSCHSSFLYSVVGMVLLGSLLVPSRVVLVFSLLPQGVPSRTCIVRVSLPSQPDMVRTCRNCCSRRSIHGSAAAGVSAAGPAA